MGLLTGLVGVAAAKLYAVVAAEIPVRHDAPEFASAGFQQQAVKQTRPKGAYTRLVAGTPRRLAVADALPGSRFLVHWDGTWQDGPNPELPRPGNGAVAPDWAIWRAGNAAAPIRRCEDGWPRRSLVVIQAPSGSKAWAAGDGPEDQPAPPPYGPAERLAGELLDRGSADPGRCVSLARISHRFTAPWLGLWRHKEFSSVGNTTGIPLLQKIPCDAKSLRDHHANR